MQRSRALRAAITITLVALATACDESPAEAPIPTEAGAALSTYADIVHANYADSLAAAMALDTAIDDLLAAPDAAGLEAIPADALEAAADPDDADGDGISGRVNRVWDATAETHVIGRFGWKGDAPSVRQQVAGAFLGDMGITTPLFTAQNCTAAQTDCLAARDGGEGEPEIDPETFEKVVIYTSLLAVPARRQADAPEVLRGKALFGAMGCGACHTPSHRTGPHPLPEVEDQLIWPTPSGSARTSTSARCASSASKMRLADPPTADTIDDVGAAERGLPAIEYLLWAAEAPWDGARCQYLVAATADTARQAEALHTASAEGFAAEFTAPDGDPFADTDAAFAALLNRMGDQVLLLRDDALGAAR